jgi:hypothetical protein
MLVWSRQAFCHGLVVLWWLGGVAAMSVDWLEPIPLTHSTGRGACSCPRGVLYLGVITDAALPRLRVTDAVLPRLRPLVVRSVEACWWMHLGCACLFVS